MYHVTRTIPALVIAILIAWYWWLHPKLIATKQIRNWGIVQSYAAFVDSYHGEHGAYPATLGEAIPPAAENRKGWFEARDAYDRPLHYSSDGVQFRIVSYGKDGLPDGASTRRHDGDIAPVDPVCRDADLDTIYSSAGQVQRCGK